MSNTPGLFHDKEYENFDWISKAVEPLVFEMADRFAAMPSEIVLTVQDVLSNIDWSWGEVRKSDIIAKAGRKAGIVFENDDVGHFQHYYDVDFGEGVAEISFDLRDIPKDKTIIIKKTVDVLPDEVIKRIVISKTSSILSRTGRQYDISRINEVMDILGCTEDRRSKSVAYKMQSISYCYSNIIQNDLWRIRNMDLAIRAAKWMVHYIEDGNLASMSNFIKMKCMTHSGKPIYSVQETV